MFCCRSRWRDCRWGWFSIFLTSSRTRKLSACFTTECGNPGIRKSMSTSFSIHCTWPCAWLASRQTTGFPVLSWFVSSSKLKFVLSREKRVWGPPSWGQTMDLSVLSWFAASSRKELVSISWERGAPLWGQTTGLSVLSWSGFGFGWLGWELLDCRATSPSVRE